MVRSDGPWRILMTLLLAVAMPLCCCSFRQVVGVPRPGPAGDERPALSCCLAGAGAEATSAEPGPADGEPCTPGDPGGCDCGKGNLAEASSAHGKVSIAIAEVAVEAPMPGVAEPGPRVERVRLRQSPSERVHRPACSLLRLHCALMV